MLISQGLDAALAGIFGLLIGSFLNVVVFRLPRIMEAQWAAECAELHKQAPSERAPFNLLTPRSSCRKCGTVIRWYQNIPVLSYLLLRGRCASCNTPIGLRYPLVELSSAALFAYCGWRWGAGITGMAWAGYAATLLTLALIDWDTTLLPDDLTLPLVWAGLIGAALGWTGTALTSALWGAVAGYLSLWLIYWGFKLLTGKEGMGYGDFKLFAALGAWLGWPALIPVILLASVIGAIIGLVLKFNHGLREGGYVPFGPFLAGAGITALVIEPPALMRILGL